MATNGKIYLVALSTLETIAAQYVPVELPGTRTNSIVEITAGRNLPRFQQTGGKEEIRIKLSFTAEGETREDAIGKVNKIRSLTYTQGRSSSPEYVKLVFGEIYGDERWIIRAVDYKLELFNPAFEFLPDMATVELRLSLAPEQDMYRGQISR